MSESKKHIYRTQNTLRLSSADLEYIDEHYEQIADTTEKIPVNKFFMQAVTTAVSIIKPKTVEVSKQEDTQKIQELEEQLSIVTANLALAKQNMELLKEEKSKLETVQSQAPPKDAIVLQFEPVWRKYIWGVLQVSKKIKFAVSYEDLIQKIFKVLNARKELVLNEEDYSYLDTLEYPFEEPKETPKTQKVNED